MFVNARITAPTLESHMPGDDPPSAVIEHARIPIPGQKYKTLRRNDLERVRLPLSRFKIRVANVIAIVTMTLETLQIGAFAMDPSLTASGFSMMAEVLPLFLIDFSSLYNDINQYSMFYGVVRSSFRSIITKIQQSFLAPACNRDGSDFIEVHSKLLHYLQRNQR